jgi:hypothetical protein
VSLKRKSRVGGASGSKLALSGLVCWSSVVLLELEDPRPVRPFRTWAVVAFLVDVCLPW